MQHDIKHTFELQWGQRAVSLALAQQAEACGAEVRVWEGRACTGIGLWCRPPETRLVGGGECEGPSAVRFRTLSWALT